MVDDLANNRPRCSALAVGERRTARGAYLMGRNLDYPVFVDLLAQLQTLFLLSRTRVSPWPLWPGRAMWGSAPA